MERDVKIICVIMCVASIGLLTLTKLHANRIVHGDVQALQQIDKAK